MNEIIKFRKIKRWFIFEFIQANRMLCRRNTTLVPYTVSEVEFFELLNKLSSMGSDIVVVIEILLEWG